MQNNEAPATARCLRCGRALRAASSVRNSYGRWCAAKIRAAVMAEAVKHFAAKAIEKARELIADGGIVPTSREGVYRTVSSKGDGFYLTAPQACTCPAGLHDRVCYHRAAATMLAVSTRKAA